MSDEVSLFALMDSHLSRTSIDDGNNPSHSTSSMLLPTPPGQRLVLPNFFPGNSPMKDFLAEQISNTLKAKEKRKQEEEEQRKMEEEMKSLKIGENNRLSTIDGVAKMKLHDEQEYVIDLTPAIIQQPKQPKPNKHSETKVLPIVLEDKTKKIHKSKTGQPKRLPDLPLHWDKETCLFKPWDPYLPCNNDISFILKQKIKRGKCSNFGKVLCSRMRPVRHIAIPYEAEKFDSNIARFDFKTKSPGDIYKENLRKPKMSQRCTFDIMDYI